MRSLKGCFEHIRLNAPGVSSKQRSFPGKLIGLLGSVPAAPIVPSNFSGNGGLAATKILGNLGAIESYFHEAGNLISFLTAEMVISHGNLTCRSRSCGY